MQRRTYKPIQTVRLFLLLLLAAGLLCGCGVQPAPANSEQASAASSGSAESLDVAESPDTQPEEEALKAQRLAQAKDGFLWDDEGYLQAVDGEGNLLSACYVGVLHFRRDGRYSSGNRELDALVASVIHENTNPDMTRMQMLEAVYDYTIGHIRYAGLSNYECSMQPAHGRNGWMPEYAIRALRDGNGNCYCFAAAFAALARGLGYQAYATGGICGGTEDPHGWVQILDEDGNMWMNDPEIEFRFGDYQAQIESGEPAPDLFYKSPDEIGAETGLSYRAQCDPYAAEKKEAEERENRSAKLKEAAASAAAGIMEQEDESAEVETGEAATVEAATANAATTAAGEAPSGTASAAAAQTPASPAVGTAVPTPPSAQIQQVTPAE